MKQRITGLTKFERYAIFLVGFVLLLGVVSFAEAVACQDWETGVWNTDPSCDQALTFEDPGVAGLGECQYRIVSINPITGKLEQTHPASGWTTVKDSSGKDCSGDRWTSPAPGVSISIGSASNCKYDGSFQCVVYQRAKDNAGNKSTKYESGGVAGPTYKIDYSPPETTISPDGSSIWQNTTIPFTLSCSDAGSGCLGNPNYGVVDIDVTCTVDKLDETGTSGEVSCSAEEKGCEKQVCYRSWDNVLHSEDVKTSGIFQIDVTAPVVDSFTIDGNSCSGDQCNSQIVVNSAFTIAWTASESGGSFLDNAKIYKATFVGGSCDDNNKSECSWRQVGSTTLAPADSNGPWSSSILDNPPNNTYWYGIHIKDNARNCITENTDGLDKGHCGGVTSDSLDTRTDKGPIKVVVQGSPLVKPTCSPGTGDYGDSVTVICSHTESETTIRYTTSTDGSTPPNPTTSSTTYTESLIFTQTTKLKVAAWDVPGVRSATPDNLYTYTIFTTSTSDPVPVPNTSINSGPSNPTTSTTASFTFSGTNSPTSFECKLDKLDTEPWESCTSPKSYPAPIGEHTFQVKASNAAGEDLSPATWNWTVVTEESLPPPPAENQPPTIQDTPVSSPDIIVKAGDDAIFSANWTDPDAQEQVKLLVCKDVLLGSSCNAQDAWCESAFTTSSPATCTYTATSSDDGNNTYNAYICDDQGICSSAKPGSFDVDAVAPIVLAFDVNPKPPTWVNQAAPNVTISWHVSDDRANDSGLKEVQVWRSGNGGVDWGQIASSPFAAPSDNWTSSINDSSAASGIYLYGIHVVDNAGNCVNEAGTTCGEIGPSSPIEVQVDKQNPSTAITDPDPVDWFNNDFFVTFNDADGLFGDSGLASACEYEFIGDNPSEPDTSSGTLSRACGSDTKNITVGPSPAICLFEGQSSCGVSSRAFDNAGNDSGWQTKLFSVDFTEPLVGIVSPILAQAGVPIEFTAALQDPVGRVTGCSFYSNPPDWTAHDASFTPVPCENGVDCTVSATYTFAGAGDYQSGFRCQDAAGNVSVWNLTDVRVDSLSVMLSANPTAGSINTKFNLSSQVAGTATGNANFKFDCTNDGTWEYEINNIDLSVSDPGWVTRQGEKTKVTAPDTFAVKDLCQYSISDIYTANNLVERGISSAQDTVLINIDISDNPEAILLQDNSSSADYCFVSVPPIILSWTFSDVNPGDNQSAYQVQVATNPGLGSPIIDTGKVQSANSEYSPPSLSFDSTYYWRVKVWDSLDNVSPFAEGAAFITPVHAYPFPSFTWTPLFPLPGEQIQFQDETVFAPGSFNQSWLWSFGDGTTSSQQNPVHTYEESSVYVVALKSSDDAGSCGGQGDVDGDGIPNEQDPDIDGDGILNVEDPDIDGDGILNGQDSSPSGQSSSGGTGGSGESIINVTLPFPEWQEISPF